MFVALAGQDGLWCGDGAERATLAPVPGWPWPQGWSGARGPAASWRGMREPQAALVCTQGWGWAGTGGGSQFPESFLLLSCSSQGRQPGLGFSVDSLLEWKKVIRGVLLFQNVHFYFK